jgi:3',5'-cyclic-AMP phosphodiesterase
MPIHLPPISRRRFLTGTLAAGAGALLTQWTWAKEPAAVPNRFLLLSDLHVGTRREDERHGVKPAKNLTSAVEQILAQKQPAAGIIVSGDCAFLGGEKGDYRLLGEVIEPLRKAGSAIHFALGNHDHRERFAAAFPDAQKETVAESKALAKFISIVETPAANWFLLDSLQVTRQTDGELGKAQLAWLAKALDARPNKPALLVAHHNPDFVMGHGLKDAKAFWDAIVPRKQVKAYIFGHTHAWLVDRRSDIHLINVPTTAWTFSRNQPRGFVAAELRPDGATLTLHSLDPKQPKHHEKTELKWRA